MADSGTPARCGHGAVGHAVRSVRARSRRAWRAGSRRAWPPPRGAFWYICAIGWYKRTTASTGGRDDHRRTASPLDNISYQDLYARWERGNWRATEIDFSVDREQWQSQFSDLEREAALWNYSLFFWGEDAVADGLSPYIDAAPLEEQKYFLATQQVDEARHAVFFKRFMEEVVGIGGTTGEALDAIKPQLTWGFMKVFDRLETHVGGAPAGPLDSRSSPRRSRSTTWSSRPRSPSRASTSSRATWRTASCSPASARAWRTWRRTSSATSASA